MQLGGVDRTTRSTSAVLDKGAKIVVRERIMTDGDEDAVTKFKVELNGEDCGADVVSRPRSAWELPPGILFSYRRKRALHGAFRLRRDSRR